MSPALAQTKFYNEDDYYNLPDDTRAELIDGQFYNMSAPSRVHQEILMFLSNKIVNHINSKNGSCKVYPAPFAVKLFQDADTIVEPDISVICDTGKLTERGCTGAPDWIIEIISPGNPGHDYVRKLNLYADAGVGEYWIADPLTKEISVYHLKEQNFRATSYTFQESITPGLFNDLYIDFTELEL
ncbi:MAG: Uma2 family endonuclease [Lachnospiraceae bacterium]